MRREEWGIRAYRDIICAWCYGWEAMAAFERRKCEGQEFEIT